MQSDLLTACEWFNSVHLERKFNAGVFDKDGANGLSVFKTIGSLRNHDGNGNGNGNVANQKN